MKFSLECDLGSYSTLLIEMNSTTVYLSLFKQKNVTISWFDLIIFSTIKMK